MASAQYNQVPVKPNSGIVRQLSPWLHESDGFEKDRVSDTYGDGHMPEYCQVEYYEAQQVGTKENPITIMDDDAESIGETNGEQDRLDKMECDMDELGDELASWAKKVRRLEKDSQWLREQLELLMEWQSKTLETLAAHGIHQIV